MPTSCLQPHCPDSMGAGSSLPCALPDSNIKFYHSQEIQQTDKDVDYVSSEAELRCVGSGTHQTCLGRSQEASASVSVQ